MKHIVFAILLAAAVATAPSMWAQNQSVRLTETQWKAVEGIYRNWQNSDMNLRFEGHGDTLFAQPLWLRNDHYQPLVRKEMAHTPEQLRPFEGLYQMEGRNSRLARLSERNNRLILQEIGNGGELSFVIQSDSSFYLTGNPVGTLDFSKDDSGHIVEMVFFKQQFWVKIKKVALTTATIRQYEGKFQSRDDPDNQLRLIAQDSNLVVKQVWDGKEIVLSPLTETFFYNEAQSYPLAIVLGADGKVKSIMILSSQEFDKVPE
ncbi:MAG TPA: hypothetical protein VGQ51_18670 [Puia sp.]|jgi:hypothetical protein|nr:hypothetical protein [Puia sp.]